MNYIMSGFLLFILTKYKPINNFTGLIKRLDSVGKFRYLNYNAKSIKRTKFEFNQIMIRFIHYPN